MNIAARLQEIAPPAGICISGAMHDQIVGKIDVPVAGLGERELKNIPRPVPVWRIDWAGGPRTVDGPEAPRQFERPAVAVLPFANMSGDPEQEYFADGITEDIITALTLWRSFPVIARNSCFTYKNRAVDIKQAARELNARYLIEGSVRKRGGRVRITAQLIDGASGHHLWAEKYDRELDDIFEVQNEIVQAITATVSPELTWAESARSASKRPEDLDAWDLCHRGMAVLRERTPEAIAEARAYFQRAIEARPDYADGYAALAPSYNNDILIGNADDWSAVADLALEAAQTAVRLDEASHKAHQELGTAYQWLNRTDDALSEAHMAVALNPNDAFTLHGLGNKSDLAGDGQGIAFMERAQKLNPRDAQLHSHLTFLARAYFNAGDFEASAGRARKAVHRSADYANAHFILALALGRLDRAEEARACLDRCDELLPGMVEQRRSWQPYADADSNRRLQGALEALRSPIR